MFGTLDMHGEPRKVTWTTLRETLKNDTDTIRLSEPVDWRVNETIVISTTTYDADHAEVFDIVSISADKMTITLNQTALYDHIVYNETLLNGRQYKIAAAVGLLSRNVRIVGQDYETMVLDKYGFRIIVSGYFYFPDPSTPSSYKYYKGSFRISNVEMIHIGQGIENKNCWVGGMLVKELGPNNGTVKSYLINSTFFDGHDCALGITKSSSVLIENNVFFHHGEKKAPPVLIDGDSNIFRRNLLVTDHDTKMRFLGDSIVAEDNFVSGATILFKGVTCQNGMQLDSKFNHSIKRNVVYGAMFGVMINSPDFEYDSYDDVLDMDCLRITDFTVFRSSTAGIVYKGKSEIIIDLNTLIDNQVGVFTYVLWPNSTTHIAATKKVYIQDMLIVGQTPVFSCENDDPLIEIDRTSYKYLGAGSNYDSKIGIVWGQFVSFYWLLWSKGWAFLTHYHQLAGLTVAKNLTFAHFDTNCKGSQDAIIAPNFHNDDMQHPITFEQITLFYVNNASKVWIHRPNIESINPTLCIDMDCDGLKKNLLTDIDGTFLGKPGHVFPQSEYQWGSQQRGLGDFRIPKTLLTASDGSYKLPSQVYQYPGIVRDESMCTYQSDWQAYECHGLDYKVLIIESMDNDTESRRLSPVAILSDNKYLDLLNGPPCKF